MTTTTHSRGRSCSLFPLIGGLSLALTACAAETAAPEEEDAVPPEPVVMDAGRLAEYARLAPVSESVELSDDELDHVLQLRQSYGLSTDADRVRAMYQRPSEFAAQRSRSFMFGNLLLDDGEIQVALERAEVEYHGPLADRWAQRELGDRYAGSYLEGTRVVLACAGCDARAMTRAVADQRDLPEVLRGRVIVRPVEHSLAELAAMEDRLAAWLRDHDLDGNGSSVDVFDNDVDLYASPFHIAALELELATLTRVAGGPVELVLDESETEADNYKDNAHGYWLVEAGQAIGPSPEGSSCTSAFAVQGYFGPFILTAGHCTNYNGELWYQGGAWLGTVAARIDGTSFDAALITTHGYRNNWGRVHNHYYDDAAPITFAVSDHNLMGQTVCNTGKATTCMSGLCNGATRCGPVVSEWHRRSAWDQPVWGVANYQREYGDSGAAIIWPTGYGFGAAGVHYGGATTYQGVYSRMPLIMSAWGLSLSPW